MDNGIESLSQQIKASDASHDKRFTELERRQAEMTAGIDALRSQADKDTGSRNTWRAVASIVGVVFLALGGWLSTTLLTASSKAEQNEERIESIQADVAANANEIRESTKAAAIAAANAARFGGQLEEIIRRLERMERTIDRSNGSTRRRQGE